MMSVACLWWLAGTSVQVATTSVGMLIAGRMLNGVCVGITSSQVPVYLAEIAKKNMRGSILVIQQLAIEVGILIMFFIGEETTGRELSRALLMVSRVRMLVYPRRECFLPDRMGHPVHSMPRLDCRATFPTREQPRFPLESSLGS